MTVPSDTQWGRTHLAGLCCKLAMWSLLAVGCARLPVPVEVIHEDQSLLIRTERVTTDTAYTHPIPFKADDLARILKGISVQERSGSFPLQLYGKASGPERLFGEREIRAIAPHLAALVLGQRRGEINPLRRLERRQATRSEERRVGKECERLCRSRWSPYH